MLVAYETIISLFQARYVSQQLDLSIYAVVMRVHLLLSLHIQSSKWCEVPGVLQVCMHTCAELIASVPFLEDAEEGFVRYLVTQLHPTVQISCLLLNVKRLLAIVQSSAAHESIDVSACMLLI